jgi:pimeloyl-ACP methyl ester carboxylesterase
MTLLRSAFAVGCVASSLLAQQSDLPSPPGQLIDIGGRQLHVLCSGQGRPTVVLEAGASSFAIDWTLVQRDVTRTTRVCSYDRAGMGWSDPPGQGSRTTDDLHALLVAAKEPAPYVLVGASRGGLMVRTYALAYPDEVAGFVFVDSSTEDRLFTMVDGQAVAIAEATPEQIKKNAPTAPVKVPRRKPQTGAPFDNLPPDLYRLRIVLDERLIASVPDTVAAEVVAASQESERASLARLRASRSAASPALGDRPTVVLTRGDEKNADREASHAALAALSSNSRHAVIAGAGHEIHLFEPAAVVQAIQDVVSSIRTKSRLKKQD